MTPVGVSFRLRANVLSLDFWPSEFEKHFTSEAIAPVLTLKLSFTIVKTPYATGQAAIVNELPQTGEL